MPKEWVESCLIFDVLCFGYHLPSADDYRGRYGRIDWSWHEQQIAAVSYRLVSDAVYIERVDDHTWDRQTPFGYWIRLERTPSRVGPAKVWFRCPSCGRRARKLYLPPAGGRFLCRTCHDLTYASRFHHPTLGERYHKLEAEFQAMKPSNRKWYPTLVKRNRTLRQLSASIDMSDYRRELLADVYGDEVAADPSVQSAPGPVADKKPPCGPTPPRPRGRPRSKRPYRRTTPLALSTPQTSTTAYCPKCRDRREMVDPYPVTFANGRRALQGHCPVCGTKMARIVKQDPPPGKVGES